jgi:type II secretory pathway pseudopilin PulG
MKHKNLKNKKGFSLIEVFASLMILSFGIAAVVILMMQSIRSSQTARDQIIASMLAQEGIELVRNLKDNGDLDGSYDNSSDSDNDLRVYKAASGNIIIQKNPASRRLSLNGNFYIHDGGTDTKFFRRIDLKVDGNILPAPSDREITATSYVTWNGEGFIASKNLSTADLTAGKCNIGNQCVSVVSVMPDIN